MSPAQRGPADQRGGGARRGLLRHLGIELDGHAGVPTRVAYVVSGAGFLGAGIIMRDGGEVRALNTAATLWGFGGGGSGPRGASQRPAMVVNALVLAGNTLLRPLVNGIDRAPLDESATDASCEVRAVVDDGDSMEARDLLVEVPEAANYPVRDVKVEERGPDGSELVRSTIDTAEIEAAIRRLEASDLVGQASRTSATAD